MKTLEVNSEKIWNPLFAQLFIANACMTLSQQMMNSIVTVYADYLGAAAAMIGVVASIYSLTSLLFKLVAGPVIDSYNKRYVLAGTMSLMAISYFGYAMSHDVTTLVAFRLILGCGQAFTSSCFIAMVSMVLPKTKIGAGMGVFSMAQAASQAVGAPIALALVDGVGYINTFFIGTVITVVGVILALRIKVPFTKGAKVKINPKNMFIKQAVMPGVIIFLMALTYFVSTSFLIVYGNQLEIEGIGYFFTVYAGCMLVTRPLIGKLTDRYGLVKILVPSMILFVSSYFIISFSTNLSMFLVAAVATSFGYGAIVPAIQSLCMKMVPPDKRGVGSATMFVGVDIGSLIGPIAAGAVADAFGYAAMWRIMTIPVFIVVIGILAYSGKIRKLELDYISDQKTEA